MEDRQAQISIRNFTLKDIPKLQMLPGYNKTIEELRNIILEWDKKIYCKRYFEMFAIVVSGDIKGVVSLYQHTSSTVSLGIEITPNERNKGYALQGSKLAIEYAKVLGYKIIASNVNKDNIASIKLQQKLGFEIYQEYVSKKNSKNMYLFVQALL